MSYEMKPLSDTPRLDLAKAFARTVHANQPYGKCPEGKKKSYEDGHLRVIVQILAEAGLTSEDDQIIAYLHDSIEDIDPALRILAHDFVRDQFSDHVYQVVWAVTGIGANRAERNAFYYMKMAIYPEAANYKVADRVANMENAKRDRHVPKCERLLAMYRKEDKSFRENVLRYATNKHLIARYEAALLD